MIDLSNLWFIYSMNSLPVDSALKDRLFIIELEGYNLEEKINIMKKFVIPNILLIFISLNSELVCYKNLRELAFVP